MNIDPAESDLTPIDTSELVAAATGHATQTATAATTAAELTPEEAEKRQNLWWYLLMGGLALLVAELIVANRLSQTRTVYVVASRTPQVASRDPRSAGVEYTPARATQGSRIVDFVVKK